MIRASHLPTQHALLSIASAIVAGGAHGALGAWPTPTAWITALIGSIICLAPLTLARSTTVIVPLLILAQAVCHGVFVAPAMTSAPSGHPHCPPIIPAASAHDAGGAVLALDGAMIALHAAAVVAIWVVWLYADTLAAWLRQALACFARIPRPVPMPPLRVAAQTPQLRLAPPRLSWREPVSRRGPPLPA